MSKLIDNIRRLSAMIKNETRSGGNTAARVGGLFEEIADELEKKSDTTEVEKMNREHDGNPQAHAAIRESVRQATERLDREKLDKTGDGKEVTVTFSEAAARVSVNSGERLSVLFGKVRRWLGDLRALAFKDKVAKGDLEAGLQTEIDGKLPKGEIVKVYKSLEANHAYVRSEDATSNVAKMYIGTCYGYNTPVDAMEVTNGNVNALGELSVKDNKVWHAGNDGSGSGLDADTVDGLHAAPAGVVAGGKLVTYGDGGDIFAAIFKDTFPVNDIDPINEICFRASQSDGYHRFCSLSRLKEALSVGNQTIAGNMILNTASESFVQFKRDNVIKGSIGLASGSNTNMYLSNDTGNSSLCLTDNGKCLANGKEIATVDQLADVVRKNQGSQMINGDISLNTLSQSCVKFFRNGNYKAYVGCGDMETTDVYLYNVISNAHFRAADNGKCYANGKEIATVDQLAGDQGGVGDRDWNTIVTPGTYWTHPMAWGTNTPPAASQFGLLVVASAGVYVMQSYYENNGACWYRAKSDTIFSQWVLVPTTTANLPDTQNKRYVTDAQREKLEGSLEVAFAGIIDETGGKVKSKGRNFYIDKTGYGLYTIRHNENDANLLIQVTSIGGTVGMAHTFTNSSFKVDSYIGSSGNNNGRGFHIVAYKL